MIAPSNCLPKRFLLIWGALLTVLGVIAGLFAIQNLPSREASPVPPPPSSRRPRTQAPISKSRQTVPSHVLQLTSARTCFNSAC